MRDVDIAHAEGEDLRRFRSHMNMVFAKGPVHLSAMAHDRLRLFRSKMSLVFQDPIPASIRG
jgi:peptide/nickel transport system ATP-binding protein